MKVNRLKVAFVFLCLISVLAIYKSISFHLMYENQVEITEQVEKSNKQLRNDIDELSNKINTLEKENYSLKNK